VQTVLIAMKERPATDNIRHPKKNSELSPSLMQRFYSGRKWEPFEHQVAAYRAYLEGYSGLLNAPTGTGKTAAIWLPIIEKLTGKSVSSRSSRKIKVIWITPLRALARDTEESLKRICAELETDWNIKRRTGDSSSATRTSITRKPPDCLITTPESLHVLISGSKNQELFSSLDTVVADEWHELTGSKRGIMTELALAYLRYLQPELSVWGMSATIGNLEEAMNVLAGSDHKQQQKFKLIRSGVKKKIRMQTLLPDRADRFPWAGHMGLKLLPKVEEIIGDSRTTLLFTNTRSQTEVWYQKLLEYEPGLAGQIAIHHGSVDKSLREWVEQAIRDEKLKVVISTSSLDLGVDFSPVETVIQVGSPKGVARYLQRAGRSGHQPGSESRIWFVPTHGMELIEADALHRAASANRIESRPLYDKPLDVLLQFLSTLAAGNGFSPDDTLAMTRKTVTYRNLTDAEWQWALRFLSTGGEALRSYPDYKKLEYTGGLYALTDKKQLRRHRLSIGTIVDDPVLKVQYLKGGFLGTIEESFISRMRSGDVFLFAGKWLTIVRLKDMTVYVRRSKKKRGIVSRWMGGRMQLSSQLAGEIRAVFEKLSEGVFDTAESRAIARIITVQSERSRIPRNNELLAEQFKSREGYHLFFYPVEGRAIHEGMASLVSWRIARKIPVTFSLAMNDFGFELLSDQHIDLTPDLLKDLFSPDDLVSDLTAAINASEMSRRHFREIARVAGLVFSGYPGNPKGARHLQASSEMLFDVFRKYDPENLLIGQAVSEVLNRQIDLRRLKAAVDRIAGQEIVVQPLQKPSPFCIPILADRLRGQLSSEELEDRIKKMQQQIIS